MIGKQIHNYIVERLIGEGGMGNVYLASHTKFDRKVAIKALYPFFVKSKIVSERFRNEAATLSQLEHPNIVALYDYIEQDGGTFLVMEYAQGQTLDDYIEEVTGPMPEKMAVRIFNKILDAVSYAHTKNIVHRDLKPTNIMITPTKDVKVLDFGIAKLITGEPGEPQKKLTQTGAKIGTILYMSPEQVKGEEISPTSDIYSLGVNLFHILTGRYPYDELISEYEISNKIVEEPLPDAREFYSGVSGKMQEIIAKATEKDPAKRYQSCEEFRLALNQSSVARDTLFDEEISQTRSSRIERTKAGEKVKQTLLDEPQDEKLPETEKQEPEQTYVLHEDKETETETEAETEPNSGDGFNPRNLWWVSVPLLAILAFVLWLVFFSNSPQEDIKTRYVLHFQAKAYKKPSTQSGVEKKYVFGDTLRVDYAKMIHGKWLPVEIQSGKTAYIQKKFLGKQLQVQQLEALLGEYTRYPDLELIHKQTLLHYFRQGNLFFDKKTQTPWKVPHYPSSSKFRYLVKGDFDGNQVLDFACLLQMKELPQFKLLVFLFQENEAGRLYFDKEYSSRMILRTVSPREEGKWFIGKEKQTGFGINQKVFENLPYDALLLYNEDSAESFLVFYKKAQDKINIYRQVR